MATRERTLVVAAGNPMIKRTATGGEAMYRRLIASCKRHPWCALSVIGAVLLLILSGVYVWYSINTWGNLASDAQSERKIIRSKLMNIHSQDQPLESIRTLAESVHADTKHLCDVSSLVSWHRHSFDAAKVAHKECVTHQRKIGAVGESLRDITYRIDRELAFDAHVASHQGKLNKTDASDYALHKKTWQEFIDQTQKLKVDSSLEAAKKAAISSSTFIVTSYDQLIAADKAEKRAEFDAAAADVQKGFSMLGEIQNLSVESYAKLVDTAQSTASTL